MDNNKVRENMYRRWANRLGLVLQKSRVKNRSWQNEGGYRLVEDHNGAIALGPNWELTLNDVHKSLAMAEQQQKRLRDKLQNG